MASDLHAHLRRRRLAVFIDLKVMAKAIRLRTPFAVARRQAEYVLIDARRIPLGFDEARFIERHLGHLHHVRDGLGYTTTNILRHPHSAHQPLSVVAGHTPRDVRLALRRQTHAAHDAAELAS